MSKVMSVEVLDTREGETHGRLACKRLQVLKFLTK